MNLSADLAQLSHRTVREMEAQQSENSEPRNQSLMNHGVRVKGLKGTRVSIKWG